MRNKRRVRSDATLLHVPYFEGVVCSVSFFSLTHTCFSSLPFVCYPNHFRLQHMVVGEFSWCCTVWVIFRRGTSNLLFFLCVRFECMRMCAYVCLSVCLSSFSLFFSLSLFLLSFCLFTLFLSFVMYTKKILSVLFIGQQSLYYKEILIRFA